MEIVVIIGIVVFSAAFLFVICCMIEASGGAAAADLRVRLCPHIWLKREPRSVSGRRSRGWCF